MSGFDPGLVHVGFLVDKLALGQVFLRVLRFPLSISFHRCSIKMQKQNELHQIHYRVAQEAFKAAVHP
jgi:hypothetical protein